MPPRKHKPVLPRSSYPASPHVIGVDWLELPVADPAQAAVHLMACGFRPRGQAERDSLLAIGGYVLRLRRTRGDLAAAPRLVLQLAVDNLADKRRQMSSLGLRPGPVRRQPRGDNSFQCRVLETLTIRCVGPVR